MRGLRLTGGSKRCLATLFFNNIQPIGVGTCGWGSVLVEWVGALGGKSGAIAGLTGTRTNLQKYSHGSRFLVNLL